MATTQQPGGGPNPLDPFNLASYYKRISAERETLDIIKAQSEFLKTQSHFRKDILKNAKDLYRLQEFVKDINEEELGTYDIKTTLQKKLNDFKDKEEKTIKQIGELQRQGTSEALKLSGVL